MSASSWRRPQRPSEPAQYFPKGADPSAYPEACLDFVAAELNGRPRKTLGFRIPAEAFAELVGEGAA